MQVTEWVTIFNLTVPSSHISALAAMVLAYLVLRLRKGKEMAGRYADAAFYFVLIWKLSYVITDFGALLKSPLSILFYNGGTFGVIIGLLVAFISLWRTMDAGSPGLLIAAVTTQGSYQIIMSVMNENGLFAETVTIVLFTVIWILVLIYADKSALWLTQLTVIFTAAHLIAAAAQPDGFGNISFVLTILFCLYHLTFGPRTSTGRERKHE